jgi:hypothetical protein
MDDVLVGKEGCILSKGLQKWQKMKFQFLNKCTFKFIYLLIYVLFSGVYRLYKKFLLKIGSDN